jgi:hypothetical protein
LKARFVPGPLAVAHKLAHQGKKVISIISSIPVHQNVGLQKVCNVKKKIE